MDKEKHILTPTAFKATSHPFSIFYDGFLN